MEIGHILKAATAKNKKFNIVVPSYEHEYKLDVIINCFLAQTSNDWMLTVVCDGPPDDVYEKIAERYSDVDNIAFHYLKQRYCDWGHTPREYGIFQSDCKWTIMTGYDNYYVPTFIERFSKADERNPDAEMIFCNFVLNHIRDGIPYNGYIDSRLEVNYIDIGNFATKTELLKTVGFPFREFAADWKLVETLMPLIKQKNGQVIKIPETLYVHN